MFRRPKVSAAAAAGASLLFYLDPLRVFLPFCLACAIHESAHILALRLLGGRVEGLSLSLGGAELRTTLPRGRLILSILAGPAANLLLALLTARSAPRLALISLLLGAYNLLPVPPLDGSQLLELLLPRCSRWAEALLLLLLGAAALTLTARGFGLWPVALYGMMLARAGVEMAVAKRGKSR